MSRNEIYLPAIYLLSCRTQTCNKSRGPLEHLRSLGTQNLMNPGLDSLGSVGGAIAAVGLLLLAAYGCGRLVWTQMTGRGSSRPFENEALRIAVGLNLVALIGI